MNAIRFTLSTGKVVLFREPKLGDQENAAQIAGGVAKSDNQVHLAIVMQKELIKLLLLKVDDKILKLQDKAQLDKLFSLKEWTQVSFALKKVMGEDSLGEPLGEPEFVNFGDESLGSKDIAQSV